MISEKVKEKLKEKTWTFQEISNVTDVINTMSNEMYDDLSRADKLSIEWSNMCLGDLVSEKNQFKNRQ